MAGRRSRNKGKRGERQGASALSEILDIPLRRGVQYKGGPDSPDISGLKQYGLHAEVKRDESTLAKRTYYAVNQAVGECGSLVPFVLSRRNREEWLIAIRLSDLVEFCNRVSNITNGRD